MTFSNFIKKNSLTVVVDSNTSNVWVELLEGTTVTVTSSKVTAARINGTLFHIADLNLDFDAELSQRSS